MTKLKKRKLKENLKTNSVIVLILLLVIAVTVVVAMLFKEKRAYKQALDNNYNMAFYQLIDNVQDMELYLDKSRVTSSPESEVEILSYIWKEANLAQTYLGMLPISSNELENTAKFLNQVSDYSYALTHKTLNNEELNQEELDNLGKLHDYSKNLKDTLNQLSVDLYGGKISWNELSEKEKNGLTKQASNISKESFAHVEENFHEYAGLIYDGAFSEHMTNPEHRGLVGDDFDEERAKEKAVGIIGRERVKNISSNGITENSNIVSYDYTIERNDGSLWWISVTKKGGHLLSLNSNRSVLGKQISIEDASKNAENFLGNIGFKNMKKTSFTENSGVATINYAYEQDGIVIYPDLIKVKVALDNGEILGMESMGYLNSHTERTIPEVKITEEEALKKINENTELENIRLSVIPTEYQKEYTCWEIKGRVEERDYLVYVNVENGRVEDVLMIINSEEGTITM